MHQDIVFERKSLSCCRFPEAYDRFVRRKQSMVVSSQDHVASVMIDVHFATKCSASHELIQMIHNNMSNSSIG
jgi:hypothetical protein